MPGRPTNNPDDYVAFGFQAAQDQEATTFTFIKHLEGSGTDIEREVQSEREGGDGQEIGLRYHSQIKGDGALVQNARPDIAAKLFAAALGRDIASSIGAGPLTDHTAVPNATMPYLTVDQRWIDEVERSTNCKLNGLTLEWEAGRPLKMNGQFISGGTVYERDLASALTPVRESGKPFFYPGASVVVGGASGARASKGKIEIKRALDDDIYTAGLNREDVVEQAFDVDVDLTLKYIDRTIYSRLQHRSGSQLGIDLPTISLDLFSPQGSSFLRAVCPLLDVAASKVNKLDPDGKTAWLDLTAMSVKGATHSFFSVVRNSATAAYL